MADIVRRRSTLRRRYTRTRRVRLAASRSAAILKNRYNSLALSALIVLTVLNAITMRKTTSSSCKTPIGNYVCWRTVRVAKRSITIALEQTIEINPDNGNWRTTLPAVVHSRQSTTSAFKCGTVRARAKDPCCLALAFIRSCVGSDIWIQRYEHCGSHRQTKIVCVWEYH